jgi:hypothetical protein
MGLFRYLSYGLSAVLIFIGVKMIVHFLHDYWGIQLWEPQPWQSLLVILFLLGTSIVASLIAAARDEKVDIQEPGEVLKSPPHGRGAAIDIGPNNEAERNPGAPGPPASTRP